MEAAEGLAEGAALVSVGAAGAHALQECADDRRLALHGAERVSVLCGHGQRGREAFCGKMAHHPHEEGKVLPLRALLEHGEDEAALGRLKQEVGILDAFGNALERQRRPEIVLVEQGGQRDVVDVGVDGHGGWLRAERATRKRVCV